jgi:hypothetical protein
MSSPPRDRFVKAPDLTQHPPRSPRVRLGGYVLLPRFLDKGRATLAGTAGEYTFGCPLDQEFLQFTGLKLDAVRRQLKAGKSDAAMLQWIQRHARRGGSPAEIAAWSAYQEQRSPADPDGRAFFNELHRQAAAHRNDVVTWFDLLDLDDFASFGGPA